MEYVPVVIAFVLALVALIGDTYCKDAHGAKRLTSLGWITLVLIGASFVYSLYAAYAQREAVAKKRAGTALVAKVVHDEVHEGLRALLPPFRQLYIDNKNLGYVPEDSITIEKMLAPGVVNKAINTCLDSRPKTFTTIPDSGTWNNIFRINITSGIDTLNNVVTQYGKYASPELISAIHTLEAKGDMSSYAHWVPPKAAPIDAASPLPRCFVGWPIGAYKQYLNMLQALQDANNANSAAR